ncbi:MAG: DUF421 domain-containing protein [Clostridia bacterium]|nr:DUF421 domain-containing protein [Clostridia bacterium]
MSDLGFWHIMGHTVLRGVFSMIALFLLAKMVGARQIAQLTFYDYISGITIGSIAAVAALDVEVPLWACILSMGIYSLGCLGSEWLTEKSIIARRFFTGTPLALVDNGQIIEKNLSKARYDVNDLLRECRCAGYFDISELSHVLLECNGKLSILPRGAFMTTINQDLQLPVPDRPLLANVIIDGNIMRENLWLVKRNEDWLLHCVNAAGKDVKNVLLCTCDPDGNLVFYDKGLTSDRGRIFT